MDPIDLQIKKRLDKLKEPLADSPLEDELHRRLRELKGIPANASANVEKKYVLFPKPQSNVEQVDNLMKQFSEEASLPSCSSTSVGISEIEQRLRNLKPQDEKMDHQLHNMPRENDTKVLLKKILAEAQLEKKTENIFPQSPSPINEDITKDADMSYSDSDSTDDFCYICDKSPKWICITCDKEYFCNKCYKEYHDEIGECHQRKAFRRKIKTLSDSD